MVIIFEFNWRGVILLIVVAICGYFIAGAVASADDIENTSFVIVEYPSEVEVTQTPFVVTREPANNNTRIAQGQCIEVGGVYDVSGVIGFSFGTEHNMFAYFGPYQDAFDPFEVNETVKYLHIMPDNRSAYYKFYVDPEIFAERPGYWYQFNAQYERSANKRAFYVSDRCMVDRNATKVVVNETPVLLNPITITPRLSGADILVSSDDPLTLPVTGVANRWVFGGSDTRALGDRVELGSGEVFAAGEMAGWSDGIYSLVLQYPGPDGIFGVEYASGSNSNTLVPALRKSPIADVTGFSPMMIRDALLPMLDQTDDVYSVYTLKVDSPYVDISGYQEVAVGEHHLLEVTGYTNKIGGTPVAIYVDRNTHTGTSLTYPMQTVLTEDAPHGAYRTFHGFIPIYYESLDKGFHTITAVLPSGKSASVDLYIREELAQHYQEPKYFKFVDGNPYVPEPEPIIIEKEVIKEVVKTEYKTIIEKEPVDYDTLSWVVISNLIVPAITVLVFVATPLAYVISLAVRAFAERRKRNLMETSI